MLNNRSKNIDLIKSSELILGLVLVLILLAGSLFVGGFFSSRNFFNILRTVSTVGILALGQSFVILTGELDLSIGSILSLSVISGATVILYGTFQALLLGILVGGLLGFINGLFVTTFKIDSLMMTLGTLSIYAGLANILSGGQAVFLRNRPLYLWLGQGDILGMPIPFFIFLLLFLFSYLFLSYTVWGKQLYYTGSNPNAAYNSGINTNKIKLIAFTLSGLFAAISGPLIAARVGRIIPYQGEGLEIIAIAMAVFGGVALKGGKGTAVGILLGVVVYQTLMNVLNLSGMGSYMEQVIRGFLLIFIVAIYKYFDSKS